MTYKAYEEYESTELYDEGQLEQIEIGFDNGLTPEQNKCICKA